MPSGGQPPDGNLLLFSIKIFILHILHHGAGWAVTLQICKTAVYLLYLIAVAVIVTTTVLMPQMQFCL